MLVVIELLRLVKRFPFLRIFAILGKPNSSSSSSYNFSAVPAPTDVQEVLESAAMLLETARRKGGVANVALGVVDVMLRPDVGGVRGR
jgi:hypothetical protein